ncbi:MAG: NAD(P)/FAD-dependent oxidoreductase [Planctomycetes bacterium]|nr:NAD(P)/FAD-dependent oxidoreductase [Planctomycetota bacterium]
MHPLPNSVDVLIIGGGAAGLVTAIFCARENPRVDIAIFDGAKKLGAKILVSGGGRCNITNRVVTAADFFGGSTNIIRKVLNAFPAEKAVAFFESIGVSLVEEDGNGKLFPGSNKSQTVLSALLKEAERLNIRIDCDARVEGIRREGAGFNVKTAASNTVTRRIVLATGGQSLPKTGSDGFGFQLAKELGHALIEPTPALDPLILEGDFHPPLSGISHPVEMTVRVADEKAAQHMGVLLWTHFGISGPVVLDASRHWHRAQVEGRDAHVSINFLPGENLQSTEARLIDLANSHPKTHLHKALAQLLPARIAKSILENLSIDTTVQMSQLRRDIRRKVAACLIDWPLNVVGGRGYEFAEATAGGVPLNEVESNTLQSRKCPGLYLAGEILDVDGRIGGFNFQWAWSSAWVVARALAHADGPTRQESADSPQ